MDSFLVAFNATRQCFGQVRGPGLPPHESRDGLGDAGKDLAKSIVSACQTTVGS